MTGEGVLDFARQDAAHADACAVVLSSADRSPTFIASVLDELGLNPACPESDGELADVLARPCHGVKVVVVDRRGGEPPDAVSLGHLRSLGATLIVTIVDRSEDAIVSCLDRGADDCIAGPVDGVELRARIKSRLAASDASRARHDFGWLVVDDAARRIEVEGEPFEIPSREFELLSFFSRFPGVAFSRDELLMRVWGSSKEWQSPRTVNEHIYRLRRRLQDVSGRVPFVTIPGAGYRFDP